MVSFDKPASEQAADRTREWTLKRNCSASPKQAAALLGSVALVSVVIASVFALMGAWWVLAWSLVEVVALATAFVVYARHAADYERVVVTPDAVIIELNSGCRLSTEKVHPALARVEYPCSTACGRSGGPLIGLASSGRVVGFGRHVPRDVREDLAREIRRAMRQATLPRGLTIQDSGF